MTYDEYKQKIDGIVADPSKLATEAVGLLEEIKKDADALAGLQNEHQAAQDEIKRLQTDNYRLYLYKTGGSAPDAKDEPKDWRELRGQEALDAYCASLEEKGDK